jgi:hypothetical protein
MGLMSRGNLGICKKETDKSIRRFRRVGLGRKKSNTNDVQSYQGAKIQKSPV